jgi:hypothetical protein
LPSGVRGTPAVGYFSHCADALVEMASRHARRSGTVFMATSKRGVTLRITREVLRFSGSQVLGFSGSQVLRFSGSRVLGFCSENH